MLPRVLSGTVLLVSSVAVAGCGGGGDGGKAVASEGGAPVGTGYTSAQLEQALLRDLGGYRRAGEADSGEYGSLKAIQNFEQLQREVTLDKPKCASEAGGRPGAGAPDEGAPAALVSFAKGSGQVVTETLVALSGDQARRLVGARVPAGCQRFRTRVGAQWSRHEVVETPPGTIGRGSRTIGVSTVTGNSHTKTWYVVLRGRRYLATISLYGPNATRDEAEKLARQAFDQAERILP